jgi:hypothetical protein
MLSPYPNQRSDDVGYYPDYVERRASYCAEDYRVFSFLHHGSSSGFLALIA